MRPLVQIETADRQLIAGLSATMAEAEHLSGDWIACRPGCTQCCLGPFAITALDALRLELALNALRASDPALAAAIRERAATYVAAIAPLYPGSAGTGLLLDPEALPGSFDDVPCPALNPQSGHCDLYEARPLTCRSFGPATRLPDGNIASCELCYQGANDEEIAACAVEVETADAENALLVALEACGQSGTTIVAFALRAPSPLS
ncbi:MAG: YkgJ family cysteine cluster protein [Bryobacterales bacterium]|nr:YkgJ family cysteine cluster protein [Bryobacterales bacterium]